jgi:hypothetical protein
MALTVEHLQAKWDEIHEDWEANVTRIYGRRNFHRIFDVVMHSPLSFSFQGVPVTRGWVEALIVGDTKCGKSEVAEKMLAFLGQPRPLNCETATLAGIVGAVKEVGGKWSIQWGALPRLNGRGAVLDEVTGLTTDQISSMSGMRSSGVAQLLKVESEKAPAKVRKLWLSNPRTNRNRKVSTYAWGVQVIPEVIGRAEDISRFDLALVAAAEEVPLEILNVRTRKTVEHRYTAEQAQALLHWAWSRRGSDVVWAVGAEDAVVDLAIEQSRKYSSQIPLVEPGEQRFRIARIAAALAVRFHSTDIKGNLVIVHPAHVELAGRLMSSLYHSPLMGYAQFSAAKAKTESGVDQDKEWAECLQVLSGHANLDVVMDTMAMADNLTRIPVLDQQAQAKLFADLVRLGLLEPGETGEFHKTRKFIDFYRVKRTEFSSKAAERF